MSIQLPPNSTGTVVDTVTLGGEDREVVVIGGNAATAEESSVKNTSPAETVYGLVTRPIQRVDGETISTANLGIGGTFTQAWQDTNQDGVSFVEAAAFADEVSASNGFRIEQSQDSTDSNFTEVVAQVTVSASTFTKIQAAITAESWRIVYVNGGTAQASFRLTAAGRQSSAPNVDSAGQLQVGVTALPDEGQQSMANSISVAVASDQSNVPGNTVQLGGTAISLNTGVRDAGSQRVTIATNDLVPISAASLPLPTGAATSAGQLADGHNVTVDNASLVVTNTVLSVVGGGTEAAAQRVTIANDSTGLLPISVASLPLPTGAATSALQLVDGHNVTVDNGAAGAAVNIQDGGNSLTVDAPVATPVNVQISDGTDTALVSASGELVTKSEGSSVDSNNSTATPLGVSGVFTGTLVDVTQYGSISIQVFADEDSATDGLSFEWSTDGGSNWDVQDQHDITANQAEQFVLPRITESFRIVYTNGTTGQGAFRLETILNPWPVSGEIEELDVMLDSKDLALTSRSVIAGETPGGNFVNVQVSTAGNFKVDVEELAGNAISLNTGTRDAGTQRVTIATDDLVPISAASLPLPSGAATSAAQLADDHNVTVSNASLAVTTLADATDAAAHGASQTGFRAMGTDGTNDQQIAVDATGNVQVDILTFPADQPFDLNQVGGTAVITGGVAGSQGVGGLAAADAAVAGNPVYVGGRSNLNEPTAVTADDEMVPFWLDRLGRLVILEGHSSPESPDVTTLSADGSLIPTPGASVSLYVKKGSVHNSAATEQVAALRDGSAGTIRWQANIAADGGGSLFDFGSRGWKLTANTPLFGDAAASSLYYNVTEYYIAA